MCPMLKHLVVQGKPSPMLDPFLTSRVASSLQSLHVTYWKREDLLAIVQEILPPLRSLRMFRLNPSQHNYRRKINLFDTGLCSRFFAAMPNSLRSLTLPLVHDDWSGWLVDALQNSLPLLEELFLPVLYLYKIDEAEKLGLALSVK